MQVVRKRIESLIKKADEQIASLEPSKDIAMIKILRQKKKDLEELLNNGR